MQRSSVRFLVKRVTEDDPGFNAGPVLSAR
jgi:hypothetical protein